MDASAIVRGMLAGLAATAAMTVLEVLARSRWGLEGLLDWQENQAMVTRITGRPVAENVTPGLAFHALHGLLAGIVFVLVLPLFPSEFPLWLLGLGYGAVLFAIGLAIHPTITGRIPWSGRLGRVAVGVSLGTHLVYGATLALLVVWP